MPPPGDTECAVRLAKVETKLEHVVQMLDDNKEYLEKKLVEQISAQVMAEKTLRDEIKSINTTLGEIKEKMTTVRFVMAAGAAIVIAFLGALAKTAMDRLWPE